MIEINGWNNEEINYLKKNYASKTNKQLANELQKTYHSVAYVANKLKLVKQPHKSWTNEEDNFLKEHYIEMTSAEISKILNRTIHSINARRDDLGLIRNANWTVDEETFLIENHNNMSYAEIGKILKRTEGAVDAKCFDMGLYKKEKPWEQWEYDFVKNNYYEMPTKEIAEYLNRTPSAIKLKAQRSGMKKYPYYCDYKFFETIDTEEKAYWLGFLTADGWINQNTETGSGTTGVELQYGDIGHLKKFNKSLNGNYRITDRWRPCAISSSDPNKKNHMCVLRIFSRIMYQSLVNLGFTNNKSFDSYIPDIPENLQRHYIRGYFDGNGSVSVSNNYLDVRFCTASSKLKDGLIEICLNNNIKLKDCSHLTENDIIVYYPEVTSLKNKLTLLDYMYKDATIYLDRKYKKYLKTKRIYGTKTT